MIRTMHYAMRTVCSSVLGLGAMVIGLTLLPQTAKCDTFTLEGGNLYRHHNSAKTLVDGDGNVAAYQAMNDNIIYVLGTDGYLWREVNDLNDRKEVDHNVRQFIGVDANDVKVMGRDGNVWLEHGNMSNRSQIATGASFIPDPSIISTPVSNEPFARGHSVIVRSPSGGWVRGFSRLYKDSGQIFTDLQLESDDLKMGPQGHGAIMLWDAENHLLATISIDAVGIGGKGLDGLAVIRTFRAESTIPTALAAKVTHLTMTVQCTGDSTQWFGWTTDEFIDAIKIGVAIVGAAAD